MRVHATWASSSEKARRIARIEFDTRPARRVATQLGQRRDVAPCLDRQQRDRRRRAGPVAELDRTRRAPWVAGSRRCPPPPARSALISSDLPRENSPTTAIRRLSPDRRWRSAATRAAQAASRRSWWAGSARSPRPDSEAVRQACKRVEPGNEGLGHAGGEPEQIGANPSHPSAFVPRGADTTAHRAMRHEARDKPRPALNAAGSVGRSRSRAGSARCVAPACRRRHTARRCAL